MNVPPGRRTRSPSRTNAFSSGTRSITSRDCGVERLVLEGEIERVLLPERDSFRELEISREQRLEVGRDNLAGGRTQVVQREVEVTCSHFQHLGLTVLDRAHALGEDLAVPSVEAHPLEGGSALLDGLVGDGRLGQRAQV